MQKIIYYVASSLDGFIAGKNNDISQFVLGGKGVEKYQADLSTFNTVIMGRKTYEFGYKYGLQPGQPAYPHMEHFIFSHSMSLENLADSVHIISPTLEEIHKVKTNATTDIYLCGGGEFAGWLLEEGLIDQLKIKLNPIILGEGIRLFGSSKTMQRWKLVNQESFDDGLQILSYEK